MLNLRVIRTDLLLLLLINWWRPMACCLRLQGNGRSLRDRQDRTLSRAVAPVAACSRQPWAVCLVRPTGMQWPKCVRQLLLEARRPARDGRTIRPCRV